MGIGAVFGAVNTMYAAVASRTREIATLRALGFGAGPVVIRCWPNRCCCAGRRRARRRVAYFAFNGYRAATMNWQSFSQVVFAFAVTPALLVQGARLRAGDGSRRRLFPAIRAARLPIATALREL